MLSSPRENLNLLICGAPLKDLALARWFIGVAVLAGIAAAFFLLHGLFLFWLFVVRIFVVRKAFGGCCWCDDVSRRKAENDVVVFLVFDRK